ncbi:hypothetical protein BC830DRAFT_288450 [Chytriomyces sp. MP71]|nr:hypothetical protein BC830DRAFT_288450 [Chytriomyces sp. MP71]
MKGLPSFGIERPDQRGRRRGLIWRRQTVFSGERVRGGIRGMNTVRQSRRVTEWAYRREDCGHYGFEGAAVWISSGWLVSWNVEWEGERRAQTAREAVRCFEGASEVRVGWRTLRKAGHGSGFKFKGSDNFWTQLMKVRPGYNKDRVHTVSSILNNLVAECAKWIA